MFGLPSKLALYRPYLARIISPTYAGPDPTTMFFENIAAPQLLPIGFQRTNAPRASASHPSQPQSPLFHPAQASSCGDKLRASSAAAVRLAGSGDSAEASAPRRGLLAGFGMKRDFDAREEITRVGSMMSERLIWMQNECLFFGEEFGAREEWVEYSRRTWRPSQLARHTTKLAFSRFLIRREVSTMRTIARLEATKGDHKGSEVVAQNAGQGAG